MNFDSHQLAAVAPLLIVLCGGFALLMLEAFAVGKNRAYFMPLTVALCVVALGFNVADWQALGALGGNDAESLYRGLMENDRIGTFLTAVFLGAAAITAMVAQPFMREHRFEFGEFYALLLFATGGMIILVQASDLVTVFVGLEIMSLAVYVLTGSWRRNPKSSEGAIKYFVTGAVASAILLYGMALVYGATGTTNLAAIAAARGAASQPLFVIGMLLMLGALGFKVAAVPFHQWAPDAYEGAPTPVTAFMAAGVKAAAFGVVLRLFGTAFAAPGLSGGSTGWASALAVLAVLTMTFGNLAALHQPNIKRMLAYSSIAHAGYLLLGVVATAGGGAVGSEARAAILFYLAGYSVTTLGAFAVVAWIGSREDERLDLDDWAGLATRHPAAAFAMLLFLLSFGGVPPTAGFFGKWYLFRAILGAPSLLPYVVIAVLNSVVSVFYYLRVVTEMYFQEPRREFTSVRAPAITAALWICVLLVLAIGIVPGSLLQWASQALLGG